MKTLERLDNVSWTHPACDNSEMSSSLSKNSCFSAALYPHSGLVKHLLTASTACVSCKLNIEMMCCLITALPVVDVQAGFI